MIDPDIRWAQEQLRESEYGRYSSGYQVVIIDILFGGEG
jgi:hypothetical protein